MTALIHVVLLSCLAAVLVQARPEDGNGDVERSYDLIQRKLDDVLLELHSRGKKPKPGKESEEGGSGKDSQEGGSGKDSQGKDSQEGDSGKDSQEGSGEKDSAEGVKGKDLKNVAKMCGVDEKDLKKLMKGEGYMIEKSVNGTTETTTVSTVTDGTSTTTTSRPTNTTTSSTTTTNRPTNTITTVTSGTATTTQAMDPTMIKLMDCAVQLQTTVLDSLTKVELDKLKSKSMISLLKSLSEMKKVTKEAEEIEKEERIRSLTEKLMELLE